MKKKLLAALLMSTALLAAGCGGDDAEEEEESPDVEGCEHLKEGPATPITVSPTSSPAVDDNHRRYDITLTGGETGGSFATFAASEASDYVIFLSQNVPLTISSASGDVVEIEESATSSTECTEIKGRHVVPLDVGTYNISFGPTTVTSFSLVIEPAAHEDHEH